MATTVLNRQIVDDAWTIVQLAQDESPAAVALPETGGIFPLPVWLARKQEIISRYKRIGLRLGRTEEIAVVADDLHYFRVIAIDFPDAADSRAHAAARLLRGHYLYQGEVGAVYGIGEDAPVLRPYIHLHLAASGPARAASRPARGTAPAPLRLVQSCMARQ